MRITADDKVTNWKTTERNSEEKKKKKNKNKKNMNLMMTGQIFVKGANSGFFFFFLVVT